MKAIRLSQTEAEKLTRLLNRRIDQMTEIFKPTKTSMRAGTIGISIELDDAFEREWAKKCARAQKTITVYKGLLAKLEDK